MRWCLASSGLLEAFEQSLSSSCCSFWSHVFSSLWRNEARHDQSGSAFGQLILLFDHVRSSAGYQDRRSEAVSQWLNCAVLSCKLNTLSWLMPSSNDVIDLSVPTYYAAPAIYTAYLYLWMIPDTNHHEWPQYTTRLESHSWFYWLGRSWRVTTLYNYHGSSFTIDNFHHRSTSTLPFYHLKSLPSAGLQSSSVVVYRLLKEVTFYEKEAKDALKTIEEVKVTEGKDEYDVRQSVRPFLVLEMVTEASGWECI